MVVRISGGFKRSLGVVEAVTDAIAAGLAADMADNVKRCAVCGGRFDRNQPGDYCPVCEEGKRGDVNAEVLAACRAMYLACATDAVRRMMPREFEQGGAFFLARDVLAKAVRK